MSTVHLSLSKLLKKYRNCNTIEIIDFHWNSELLKVYRKNSVFCIFGWALFIWIYQNDWKLKGIVILLKSLIFIEIQNCCILKETPISASSDEQHLCNIMSMAKKQMNCNTFEANEFHWNSELVKLYVNYNDFWRRLNAFDMML